MFHQNLYTFKINHSLVTGNNPSQVLRGTTYPHDTDTHSSLCHLWISVEEKKNTIACTHSSTTSTQKQGMFLVIWFYSCVGSLSVCGVSLADKMSAVVSPAEVSTQCFSKWPPKLLPHKCINDWIYTTVRCSNDLSNANGRVDGLEGHTGFQYLKLLQRLEENDHIVGDPAHHKHTDYGKYQLYSFHLVGVPGFGESTKDSHIAENHDGETHKKAHCVLSKVSLHLPKLHPVFWVLALALLFLQGGKYHLRGCQHARYKPDYCGGYDPIVKRPGSHGRYSMNDGQVAVHTH